MLEYLLFFFNIFFLLKKNSKRCEHKTENPNTSYTETQSRAVKNFESNKNDDDCFYPTIIIFGQFFDLNRKN